jgi:hypothetical protein
MSTCTPVVCNSHNVKHILILGLKLKISWKYSSDFKDINCFFSHSFLFSAVRNVKMNKIWIRGSKKCPLWNISVWELTKLNGIENKLSNEWRLSPCIYIRKMKFGQWETRIKYQLIGAVCCYLPFCLAFQKDVWWHYHFYQTLLSNMFPFLNLVSQGFI